MSELVRLCTHKIQLNIEPLVVHEDYFAPVLEIINLT